MDKQAFDRTAEEIRTTVHTKNAAYGDSVNTAPQCLKLMAPQGIPPEKYRDAACVLRVLDKLSRALAMPPGTDQESPWGDAAAYCLMRAAEVAGTYVPRAEDLSAEEALRVACNRLLAAEVDAVRAALAIAPEEEGTPLTDEAPSYVLQRSPDGQWRLFKITGGDTLRRGADGRWGIEEHPKPGTAHRPAAVKVDGTVHLHTRSFPTREEAERFAVGYFSEGPEFISFGSLNEHTRTMVIRSRREIEEGAPLPEAMIAAAGVTE